MKKSRILVLTLCLLIVCSIFSGCNSKDTFKKDFNIIAKNNGLSQLPEEMTKVSETNNLIVESAEVEPGITITTETTKKGFTSQITIQTQENENNWEKYAKTIIELYLGDGYTLNEKVSALYIDNSLEDFYIDLPTTTKINETVTAHTIYTENGDESILRTIKISRSEGK